MLVICVMCFEACCLGFEFDVGLLTRFVLCLRLICLFCLNCSRLFGLLYWQDLVALFDLCFVVFVFGFVSFGLLIVRFSCVWVWLDVFDVTCLMCYEFCLRGL